MSDFGNISGANASSTEYTVKGEAVHVHVDDSGAGGRTAGDWDGSTATVQLKCKDDEWVDIAGSGDTVNFDDIYEIFHNAVIRINWTGGSNSIELYYQFHSVRY